MILKASSNSNHSRILWFYRISEWPFIWWPQMTEVVFKKPTKMTMTAWIVRKWYVLAKNSLCWSCKDEDEFGTAFLDGGVALHWTFWACPQIAEHDPSISAKVWRGPWSAFGALQIPPPLQHQCIPLFRPTWHFASKWVSCTEAAQEVPVALIAQEIFQVYLIFEHRQSLPGKTAHCICSFCLCKPMGISALALLVASVCKGT